MAKTNNEIQREKDLNDTIAEIKAIIKTDLSELDLGIIKWAFSSGRLSAVNQLIK